MSRILIIEDELGEAREMQRILAESFKRDKIYTTGGHRSIEMIDSVAPDVVTLDIISADGTGARVADHIARNHPATKMVVVSASGEFEFARSAIAAGAADYLLKPVRPETLVDSIGRVLEGRRDFLQCTAVWPYLQVGLEDALLDRMPHPPGVVVATCCPGCSQDPALEERFSWALEEFLRGEEWRESRGNIQLLYLPETPISRLRQRLARLSDTCRKRGLGDVRFGVGRGSDKQSRWSYIYEAALYAYYKGALQTGSQIEIQDYSHMPSQPGPYPAVLEQALVQQLDKKDFPAATEALDTLLDYFLTRSGSCSGKFDQWVTTLNHTINVYCSLRDVGPEAAEVMVDPRDPDALRGQFLQKLQLILKESWQQVRNPFVAKTIRIVQERYNQRLILNNIAEELYISPIYLSRLFREETGYSFKDYRAQVRMEAAQRALLEGSLSIAEIAEQCGFASSNYFSESFKSYYGVSPSEYKKQVTVNR